MSSTPWIVVREGLEMVCKRCNTSYKPTLPIPMPLYIALSKEFLKNHRRCKARAIVAERTAEGIAPIKENTAGGEG